MSISISNVSGASGVANNNLPEFDFDLNLDEKTSSRQVGNVKSEVSELYTNGKFTNKTVKTYYVDRFQREDKSRPVKTTTYSYDDSGILKKIEMNKECKFNNEYKFNKTKIGNNGKWFNAYLKTPDIMAIGNADGRIKYANFGIDLDGLQTKIKNMPKHAQKMFYAALDFLMENIKKIR